MFPCRFLLLAILTLSLLLTMSCTKQMALQPRLEPQGQSDFFDDHRVEREPIPGTVAAAALGMAPPPSSPHAILLRGQERYAISCVPCHDRTGGGNGSIVQSGFTRPEPLDSPALLKLTTADLVNIIRDGKNVMAGYRGLVSPEDMVAIAKYVKVLQLRTHVPTAWLSETDKAALGGAP